MRLMCLKLFRWNVEVGKNCSFVVGKSEYM